MLRVYGMNILPSVFESADIIGSYSGLRPATEYRDYQIHSIPEQNWIYVGGIRSTGLSASSGIGEYVTNLYEDIRNKDLVPDLEDRSEDWKKTLLLAMQLDGVAEPTQTQAYLKEQIKVYRTLQIRNRLLDKILGISEAVRNPIPLRYCIHNTPLPSVQDLARDFKQRGTGLVLLYGKEQRVTHPVSIFGMES